MPHQLPLAFFDFHELPGDYLSCLLCLFIESLEADNNLIDVALEQYAHFALLCPLLLAVLELVLELNFLVAGQVPRMILV